MKIYAAYKGDTFLIVDTAENVAKYLGVSAETVRWHTSPAGYARALAKKNGLVIIAFEEP